LRRVAFPLLVSLKIWSAEIIVHRLQRQIEAEDTEEYQKNTKNTFSLTPPNKKTKQQNNNL